MNKEEFLKIYKYIRICLYYHHGGKFNNRKLFKDMQHDLFLYLFDKSVFELTSQSKRYIFILSQFYPWYIIEHKYSRKAEEVLLDIENEPIEPGISYFPNGDTLFDLELIEKKPKEILTAKALNVRPILVTYLNNNQEVFDSIEIFCTKIGCRRSTANLWLRFGKGDKRRYDKYGHIFKLEYLA